MSNYRQLFSTAFAYYDYAFDLLDTGRYYLRFDALARLWRDTLPASSYTEVRYEDVVEHTEREARRLIAFCGLDVGPALPRVRPTTQLRSRPQAPCKCASRSTALRSPAGATTKTRSNPCAVSSPPPAWQKWGHSAFLFDVLPGRNGDIPHFAEALGGTTSQRNAECPHFGER